MSEMTDRMARAICETLFGFYDPAEIVLEISAAGQSMKAAKAVLAVMREPTVRMRHAGADTFGLHTPHIGQLPQETIDGQPTKAWQAMIDQALEG